jgi:transposase
MENNCNGRHELSLEDWNRLKPIFRRILGHLWRTRQEKDRIMLNGMLWILATGAPWRDLPEKYGGWNTVYRRFSRWRDLGLWSKILEELTRDRDPESIMIDGSGIRAHQHAAGAKGGQEKQALGRSCGGFSTKMHAAVDALANPLRIVLTAGQAHDVTMGEKLLQGMEAEYILADRGYDS